MKYLIIIAIFSFQYVSFGQSGKENYLIYCSGCHGASMKGTSSTTSLLKENWTDESSKEKLIKTIKEGVPNTKMLAWNNQLSPSDVNAIADYIIDFQENEHLKLEDPTIEYLNSSEYKLEVVEWCSEGLEVPWAIEFIDSHKALVSERNGKLKWLIDGKEDPLPIVGLPKPHIGSSTGGFMDIALDPNYDKNGWVYLAYSQTNEDNEAKDALALTKIIRGKIKDHQWQNEETLFEVSDDLKVRNGNRWGCRFLFDKEGYLFFSIGDMARAEDSQDPSKATGKVFRIYPDGSIPEDNPFINKGGALAAVYSLGNRNVQGISMHPETGEIWMTEHGPKGGDELNILKKGANYGWPVITYGVDYDGSIISEKTHQEGMEQPITYWTPSIAVCPAEFVEGELFPAWKNNLLVGALAFQEVRRIVIDQHNIVKQELLIKGKGRVRDLKFGPDGALYIVTNGPDKILRVVPVQN
ncbi:PQQ-dependent sugar dehydrogenase [Echinicola salinicaeni]|uniref:PQQ-dependent sugar dehydrogenase n=1 Tax=Echinicola salinicaeni TaxID=2762757 RepID=UPI001644F8F8|nr:PQQ-dependent sugar dehydrogenase [Echinicola salinicaeni]